MKVILLQDVEGLGKAGDLKEVANGYARNYLVPRGDAVRWTRGAEKQIEQMKSARAARAARDADHANEIKGKLEAAPVSVRVRAGADGRLYGAVTTADIASAVAETTGESIDKRSIVLGNPIKSLGVHQVSVRIHDEVSATVALNVVAG